MVAGKYGWVVMRFGLSGYSRAMVSGVLLLVLLAVPVSGAMGAPMKARDLTGTNMPGIDHWNTLVNSAQECSDLCDATPGCEGATYVLPNTIQGADGHCWRKSIVTGDVENFNCISFLKQTLPGGGGCFGVTPAADFSAFPVSGAAPYAVQFSDKSVGAVSWVWDFGDMTSGSDNLQQNPLHVYTAGNAQGIPYTVKLTVTGTCPGTSDTRTRAGFITVYDNIGVLDVVSVPAGARVRLDSQDLGTTPYKNFVTAGTHTLLLTMDGYHDYTATVTIAKNQQNKVTAGLAAVTAPPTPPSPAPAAGTLQITTAPDGAAVFVDGGSQGLTSPATLSSLAPGTHTVRLAKAGYTDYEGTVTIQAGKTVQLSIVLVPAAGPSAGATTAGAPAAAASAVPAATTGIPAVTASTGTLTVRSTPAGAAVYLDDHTVGTTPFTARNVPAGPHRLLVSLQGYQDITQVVEITGGTESIVSADFTTAQKTPGFDAALPPAAVALAALAVFLKRKDN